MRFLYLLFFLFLAPCLIAQNMLVVEKPGTVNNKIYYAGNNIDLKTIDGLRISGPINVIRDSMMVVDFVHEVKIKDIEIIYKLRYGLNITGSALISGGALYLGLDLINNQSIDEQGIWVASGVIVSGIIMKLFAKKRMRLEEGKWRAKILVE
ncbi:MULTISPECIES: hypothetical protein [unclassified Lentimicrobium]|uniref:hypothetical protein n=1 Tax=unclassified Lentimicrobium TaxID=2677434 RepID=UPI001557D180|nr:MULTISPECIES: hypothetical protein [unclassified Lentimicrobium]NPD48115.1 hypothetical protein [Lentimicrobium sp. S6]NPD83944.1 hypothetical protein [Lentimicrobium sp. L6]